MKKSKIDLWDDFDPTKQYENSTVIPPEYLEANKNQNPKWSTVFHAEN